MSTAHCWKCESSEFIRPSQPMPGSGERAVPLCPECYVDWMAGDFTVPLTADEIDPRQSTMFDFIKGTP